MKELQTQRLLLRDFSMEDLDDFYTYCANPDVGIHAAGRRTRIRNRARRCCAG